jgi:hypothetical protein
VLLFWIVFLLGNAACAALTHRAEHAAERAASYPKPNE